ncbi:MAG: substrate-binding domain-containing protein [Desulfarculaceae bacterium]|nr:substrate-binding domain-containing protein [Desulfarculaceae bacterium]
MKKSVIGKAGILALMSVLLVFGSAWAGKSLMMATTTSTDNTGLLEYLEPEFEQDTGIDLKWTATGTGKALELGRRCDVDVLLVHAPPAEKAYVENGYGKDRKQIMYNDFVIIGPDADPAGIKGKSIGEALEKLKSSKSLFVSRGDDSGTNKKELLLWDSSGIKVPERAEWYLQTGQGMLATINVTEERNGYTMTDRGTYIKYRSDKGENARLSIMVEGDEILMNQYSVIAVNPDNCPDTKYELAVEFGEWMAGERAQDLIADFRLLGKKLFIPNAH